MTGSCHRVRRYVWVNKEKQHILEREEYIKRIREFCLFDDTFMMKCFEDSPECVELLLRVILDSEDLKLREIRTQYLIKNLQGRSIRMDIFAVDEMGRKYNIEVQRAKKGADARRARYNSSLMDANVMEPGRDYPELSETYVIFIAREDVLGNNRPISFFQRRETETGEALGDASNILYVNGTIRDDTPLGKLMSDFSCTKAGDMHYAVLAERVSYFKEQKEGVKAMCEIMEELYFEGVECGKREGILEGMRQGISQGVVQGRNKMILCFLSNGGTEEEAMKMLSVTREDIETARKESLSLS